MPERDPIELGVCDLDVELRSLGSEIAHQRAPTSSLGGPESNEIGTPGAPTSSTIAARMAHHGAAFVVLACAFTPVSAFAPVAHTTAPRTAYHRRVHPVTCIAKTPEEKALLQASKKVVMVAKRFGVAQGKGAQAWVEQAVKGGDARTESLISMQLALFDECSLDDKSGRCKDLTAAMDAMVSAVEKRSSSSFYKEGILKPSSLTLQFGPTAVQSAATKLRKAAAKFGPEQKAVADAWIKKAAGGDTADTSGLLEEQITLFGECVLSEDGTPSNCQLLEEALASFQETLETCNIESSAPCAPPEPTELATTESFAAAQAAEEAMKQEAAVEALKEQFGEAPEGYKYDRFGRLILTSMGK